MLFGIEELDTLHALIAAQGIAVGLRFLNDRVPHRYSAIYELKVGVLRNVAIVDKTGETQHGSLMAVPLANSFCQFTLRDGFFRTDNSALDHRLDGHPAQGRMMAYHAVPLLGGRGELFGTLCHLDWNEQPLDDDEFRYLQRASRVLSMFLPSAND